MEVVSKLSYAVPACRSSNIFSGGCGGEARP